MIARLEDVNLDSALFESNLIKILYSEMIGLVYT